MCAYAHATLDFESIKRTVFSAGAEVFDFIRNFYSCKGLQTLFVQRISIYLENLIRTGSAQVRFDDILLK